MMYIHHVKKTSFSNIFLSEMFPLGKNFIGNFWLFLSEPKYLRLAILHLAFIVFGEVKKELKLKAPKNGNTYFL